MPSKDLASMEKEELIKALMEAQESLKEAQKALTSQEKTLKSREKEIQIQGERIEEHKAEISRLNENLTHKEAVNEELKKSKADIEKKYKRLVEIEVMLSELLPPFKEGITEFIADAEKIFSIDMDKWEEVLESVKASFNEFIALCRNNRGLFKAYNRKSEKLSPKQARKLKNQNNNQLAACVGMIAAADQAVKNSVRKTETLLATMAEAAKSTTPEESGLPQDVLEALVLLPNGTPSAAQPSKGRQAYRIGAPREPAPTAVPAAAKTCPECGKELKDWGWHSKKIRSVVISLSKLGTLLEAGHKLTTCCCGFTEVRLDEEAPIPLLPNASVSIELLNEMSYLETTGTPINRMVETMLPDLQLGGETPYKLQRTWVKNYLSLLLEGIKEQAKKSKVVLMDETWFDCLQIKGEGVCVPVEEPKSTSSLILAMCAGPWEEHPFVLYSPIATRAAENIAQAVEGMKPEVIVSDAYPGYDSLLKREEFDSASHQNCLVHARRTCLDVLSLKSMEKELEKPEGQQKLLEKVKERIKEGSPLMAILAVVMDLTRIMHREAQMLKRAKENPDQRISIITESRKESRKNLERIKRIIDSLAPTQADLVNGQWQSKKTALYGKPVVYFLNNKEKFETFLDDWRVPYHSNSVEQKIRPLTLLRKNCNFFQSEEGMKAACAVLSLYATARANGITDIGNWLNDYSRALYNHCVTKGWTQEVRKAVNAKEALKDPSKLLMINWKEEWAKFSKDFDASPWYPWNFAKLQKTSEN